LRGAVPLTVNGTTGVSDMNVTFAVKDAKASGQGKVFDVVLLSQRLFADDLVAMAQAFQTTAPTQAGTPTSGSTQPAGQAPAPSEPVASAPQEQKPAAEQEPGMPVS